jgi:hypothetical protein
VESFVDSKMRKTISADGGTLVPTRSVRGGVEVFMEQRWWWCLEHQRVEPDLGCAGTERLGPFGTPEDVVNVHYGVAR